MSNHDPAQAMTDDDAVAAFRAALRHPTVAGSAYDAAVFSAFHETLRSSFPLLFAAAESVEVPGDALLLRVGGTSDADPLVLMAHQDVVPIEPSDTWTHPPFDAHDDGEFLWGRGTLDDKGSLVAICVAIERLLGRGVTPRRDVWLSFGADEEVMGHHAGAAVEALRARGVTPFVVLDEGGAVASEVFPGVTKPVAMIGVAEKGTADLRLVAHGDGGHASTPKRGGATAKLARAISALDANPAPARLTPTAVAMFDAVAEVAARPLSLVLGRIGSASGLFARVLTRLGPETAAIVRTTRAVTMLEGSKAQNVIATTATAGVNMRISVGESLDEAVRAVERAVAPHAQVELIGGSGPTQVAPVDHPAFETLRRVTREVLADAHVAPYVMNQATDARHFHAVWPHVYRFTPFHMSKAQRESLHNVDERITRASWLEGVRWYERLVEEA